MIYGIGTDIVAISRFQRFLDENNNALIKRLFTDFEQTFCNAKNNSAASYAARFSAKEAFLKALGTGLRDGLSWHDIELRNNDLGKPELFLSGKAQEIFLDKHLTATHVSISHDGDSAIAFVVLESP